MITAENQAKLEMDHPGIVGQPRFRSDAGVYAQYGWYQLVNDKDYGEWWWPVWCNSGAGLGIGDCAACSGIPEWADIMAQSVEALVYQRDTATFFS